MNNVNLRMSFTCRANEVYKLMSSSVRSNFHWFIIAFGVTIKSRGFLNDRNVVACLLSMRTK